MRQAAVWVLVQAVLRVVWWQVVVATQAVMATRLAARVVKRVAQWRMLVWRAVMRR